MRATPSDLTAIAGATDSMPVRQRHAPSSRDDTVGTQLWHGRHVALMAGIGLLLGLHRAEAALDSDTLWSARYGMDVLSSGRLPRSDTYSWTAFGHQWIPSSWGWNLALGAAYRGAGLLGIWLVGIALAVGLAIAVAHAAARIAAPPLPTALLFAVLGGVALVVAPRAQTIGYVLVLAIPPVLAPVLYRGRAQALPAAAALCGLQVLWMNLHSSALLGPALIAVGGIGLLLRPAQRPGRAVRRLARLAAVVVATAACCLATPYGAGPVLHVRAVRSASVGLINEWDHPGFGNFAQLVSLIAIAVAVLASWLAYRSRRFDTAGILLLLVAATASAIRFAPMIVVFAIPELAAALGILKVRPFMFRRIVAAVCAVLGVFAIANVRTFARRSTNLASPRLVAALPRDCHVANDYTLGATVILLRPDVRVSIDGRNDMYGRALVLSAVAMLEDSPGTAAKLHAARVNCVLAPSSAPLVAGLSHDSDWHVVGHDGYRTLLVRTGTSPAGG